MRLCSSPPRAESKAQLHAGRLLPDLNTVGFAVLWNDASRQHRGQFPSRVLLWPPIPRSSPPAWKPTVSQVEETGPRPGWAWVRFNQFKFVAGSPYALLCRPPPLTSRRRLSSYEKASSVCGFPLGPASGLLYVSLAWVNRSRPERRWEWKCSPPCGDRSWKWVTPV